METKSKKIIERCYSNINDVIQEIETVQELYDEEKEKLEQSSDEYKGLVAAADKLDAAITALQESNRVLIDNKLGG